MANILIVGGGFGGVMAAESLVKQVSEEHQITLVSRSRKFLFYPDLVRLAFGKCEPDDISFDLREAMLDRRIRFIEGEVALVDPYERRLIMATLAHFSGDKRRAAETLGISLKTLYNRLNSYRGAAA